ncbi:MULTISPECIES: PIN domain-containing protein [Acinetobacter]|uniref:PIN domain-containing protein n=1 Tax=Acinetobacter TaxID=469 RepID=UPI000BCCFC43|nr:MULTISPECIES: PIN domain-containing protein [unclassified Acinetobacter]PCN59700.1 PIN domain-containing protein [Acinetobacter sp. YT-02]TCB17358.1 PIN domain-containing protein [Acinetobacter sp. ANC 5045]
MIILDTNALITLLMTNKNEAEFKNLNTFLKQNEKLSIALPMPVISEFIAGDDNEARSLSLLKPNSKFKNLDFDAKAALIAAKIYRDYRQLPQNQKSQEPRQKVKVDIQIIGIALANNATILVSHDNGVRNIVNELDLNLSVFDYMNNHYFEQMASLIVAESQKVQ